MTKTAATVIKNNKQTLPQWSAQYRNLVSCANCPFLITRSLDSCSFIKSISTLRHTKHHDWIWKKLFFCIPWLEKGQQINKAKWPYNPRNPFDCFFQGCGEFIAVCNPGDRQCVISVYGILAHLQHRWCSIFWRTILQMRRQSRGAPADQHRAEQIGLW